MTVMAAMHCFFATDLHGRVDRYRKLFEAMAAERPRAVFLGGDLLPNHLPFDGDFVADFLAPELARLRATLGASYPEVFAILGNDDGRAVEAEFAAAGDGGLWRYAHGRVLDLDGWSVVGYAYVPPTPFLLKDWERYDVSRYVDPGVCCHTSR